MTVPTVLQQGRYEVRYELTRDANGIAYLALDTKMAHREVLVRQLRDNAALRLFERIAQLNHAALPAVFDLFEEHGHRYMVLEHPSGQSLADIVLGPRLKETVVLAWAKQIAAGLSYLHQQRPALPHGDLRPANMILHDGQRIKLIGGVPGGCVDMPPTRYSAPERWNGAPPAPAGDVYSFAATLHHLITGVDPNQQPLHTFADPATRRSDLSPTLVTALQRGLSHSPADRWPSIEAMMQAWGRGAAQSSEIPAIGFTPSPLPSDPTSRFEPTPNQAIPVPQAARRGATQAYQTRQQPIPPPPAYDDDEDDYYEDDEPEYAPASRFPRRPDTSNSWGPLLAGVLLALVVVGAGAWLAMRFFGGSDPSAPERTTIALASVTPGAEGRPLTALDLTSTALALQPQATPMPTVDNQATAQVIADLQATLTATTGNLQALYDQGLAHEANGDLSSALSTFQAIVTINPNFLDVQQRVNDLQARISATATAGALPTATPEPTATAEPTPTPAPTPTPLGQIFGDSFDGTALSPALWTTTVPSGTVVITDGALKLEATDALCFPIVRTLTETAFPEGDFSLTVRFRYTDVTPFGSGITLSSAMPEVCGGTDQAGARFVRLWQDVGSGLVVDYHRDATADEPEKDARLNYSPPVDTSEHILRIERQGDSESVYLDDNLLYTELAGERPTVLWFGNTQRVETPQTWTALEVSEVRLTTQP